MVDLTNRSIQSMVILQAKCDDLLKPLQTVTGVVERRSTQPILSNVLIERAEGQLHFLASDNDIQVRTTISGLPGDNFRMTTSARKLQDILRAMPETASVSLDYHDNHLIVRSGKSRFNLQTLSADDFPCLGVEEEAFATFTLPQHQLHQLLSLVQYSIATQDIRYYLNGLFIQIKAEKCCFVATDGHRLAYASTILAETIPDSELILPRKTVTELYKLLSVNENSTVTIKLFAKQVAFDLDNIQIISKIIDGKFPNYNDAIPLDNDKIFLVNRLDLLHALQRAAILANEKDRSVEIILKPNLLLILCANNEQEKAEEELEIVYQGEELTIHFNINYLLDLLNNSSEDTLQLALSENRNPALFVVPGNPNFKYVVMPLRI